MSNHPLPCYAIIEDQNTGKKKQIEIDMDVNSLLAFFLEYPEVKGELFFADLSGVGKAKFDTVDYKLSLEDINANPKNVNVIYDKKSFNKWFEPVERALSLLSLYRFLKKLETLLPPRSAISKLIKASGVTSKETPIETLPHLIQGVVNRIIKLQGFSAINFMLFREPISLEDRMVQRELIKYGSQFFELTPDEVSKITQAIEHKMMVTPKNTL